MQENIWATHSLHDSAKKVKQNEEPCLLAHLIYEMTQKTSVKFGIGYLQWKLSYGFNYWFTVLQYIPMLHMTLIPQFYRYPHTKILVHHL